MNINECASWTIEGVVTKVRDLKAKNSGEIWRSIASVATFGFTAELVIDNCRSLFNEGNKIRVEGTFSQDRGSVELWAQNVHPTKAK